MKSTWIVSLALIGCATMCLAQQAPAGSEAEFRAAKAWAFPLNPPLDPRASAPDMHQPLHVPDIAPPLAGRWPTYIVRELILFRRGGRANAQSAPMRQEVSQLTLREMIAVAAFAASLAP